MEEKKPQTGAEVLTAAQDQMKHQAMAVLKDLLYKNLAMIAQRKQWISARQSQIKKLEDMQVEMVKLYDAGNFNSVEAESFDRWMKHLNMQVISRTSSNEERRAAHQRWKNRHGVVAMAVMPEEESSDDE